jgi:hypothetical protein
MEAGDEIKSGKEKYLYWAALAMIIVGTAVIRGRMASMPLERDEGEYAYMAQELLRGVLPYESAYSMKLPGIYAAYAAILAVFGQTATGVHTGLIVLNAATILFVFLLAREIFGGLTAVVASGAYAIISMLSSVLGMSANAEHFVVLPALAGIWLLVKFRERKNFIVIFISAILLGTAFIIKQHGVFFGVFGALYLLSRDILRRPIQWKKAVINQIVFAAGAIIPFALVCFIFWKAGFFGKFWFWTFTYASKYAARIPLSAVGEIFVAHFSPVVESAKWIWVFVPLGLAIVIVIKQYRRWILFLFGFLTFSFFAVCPGFYFRHHYFIFLLPAAAILSGGGLVLVMERILQSFRIPGRTAIIGITALAIGGYCLYQQRAVLFRNNPEVVCRMVYGFNPFSESVRIADFIRANTDANDKVAVIGSEPQIYFYSGRRAATTYIYTYPLMEPHDFAGKMQEEMINQIEDARPQILVFVRVYFSWLQRHESIDHIFRWFDAYQSQYYEVVGYADMVSGAYTVWKWNEDAVNYKPTSENWVAVLRRKQ